MGGATEADLIRLATLLSMSVTIGFARMYGFTFVFPLFGWMEVRGPLRFAIAFGLSVPSIVAVHGLLQAAPALTPGGWVALVVKEAVVGALLGGLYGLPFWAIQGVGDMVEVYRGASAANLFDPVHAQETSIGGKFLIMLALVLFVALGGVADCAELMLASYRSWRALEFLPLMDWAALRGLGAVIGRGLTLAVVLGAPLVLVLLLVDVALIFAVRSARSFQINDLNHAARGLMLLLVLPVFVTLFGAHLGPQLRALLLAMRAALGLGAG